MALYQPSFMVPHNEAIDVTNADDMKFKWQLNGNNMLCAYNIQIYDVNKNTADNDGLVYELVSTTNQRAIQKNINTLISYIDNQDEKLTKISEYKTEYASSKIRSNFKKALQEDRQNAMDLIEDMKGIYADLLKFKENKKPRRSFFSTKNIKIF